MSDPYTDLLNKTAMLGQAQGDLSLARSAEAGAHMQTSSANRRAKTAEKLLAKEETAHEQTKRELANAQAMIIDWMHTNEGFKRLARAYGKKLALTDAQRQNDMDDLLLDLVEENHKFKGSEPHRHALLRRTGSPSLKD